MIVEILPCPTNVYPCACDDNTFPEVQRYFHTVNKKWAHNFHCNNCNKGLGQFVDLEKLIERWNEYQNNKRKGLI
jgi:hypothetical protein